VQSAVSKNKKSSEKCQAQSLQINTAHPQQTEQVDAGLQQLAGSTIQLKTRSRILQSVSNAAQHLQIAFQSPIQQRQQLLQLAAMHRLNMAHMQQGTEHRV